MTRYIRLFFIVAISIPIAYLYALPFGLFAHTLFGSTPEVMAADLRHTTVHFVSAFLGSIVLMLAFINIHLWLRRDIYRRTHDATMLARRFITSRLLGEGELSEEEEARFHHYCDSGVLKHNGLGQLRVSDRAVDELWGW